MGAIAMDGTRALRLVKGYVNGEVFLDFLEKDLVPNLRPGDTVVMDGPSIHRVAGVEEVLAKAGAKLLYLPAYSPELNPIEEVWASVKKRLRDAPPRKLAALSQAVWRIWGDVGAALCSACIGHSGYAVST